MKTIILLLVAALTGSAAISQIQNPVQWDFSAIKINATTYEVHLTATLSDGWHIYSQTTPEGGPVPTLISFTNNPLIAISGSTKEKGKLEQRHEELFGVDVKQYSGKVVFVQKLVLKGKVKTSLNGSIEFMTCNDRECLPPKSQKFSIAIQ